MADTVKYNGQEYGTDFVDFAGRYAGDYANHKQMNQAQREAFMRELQSRQTGMRGGADGIDSQNNDIVYTGAITGKQKKDERAWNGMDRDAFNVRNAVDEYLMGMSGRYTYLQNKLKAKQAKEEEEKDKANQQPWIRHTGGGESTLAKYLSKMWGNNSDMSDWANSTGDVYANGVRTTSGRYNALNSRLREYLADIEAGKYGDKTDDMLEEIDLVNQALSSPLDDTRASAYKRILGNNLYDRLFFTGEKYMTPEEAESNRVKQEVDDRMAQRAKYVAGEPDIQNPYDKNTQPEDWAAAERDRQVNMDRQEMQNFGTSFQGQAADFNYDDMIDEVDINLLQGISDAEHRQNLDAIANGEMASTSNGSELAFWHPEGAGWGENDTSLAGTPYESIYRAAGWEPNDTWRAGGREHRKDDGQNYTNAGVKARIALDYASALAKSDLGAKYMLNDNSGYLLPQFIDWNTNTGYVFSFNGGKAQVRKVNLQNILSNTNVAARQDLFNRWRQFKNKAAIDWTNPAYANVFKEGGVLKAQKGAPISPEEMALRNPHAPIDPYAGLYNQQYQPDVWGKSAAEKQAELQADRDHTLEIGAEARRIEDHNNSLDFSASDWARLGTAVADLTGAVISLSGFSPVGAAIGAGSTLTQFGLDIADGDVGMTDALKALGVGLALDAASLIPGNAASGIAKAAKTLSKFAVPIISAMQVMGNAEGAIATAKKVFSGDLHGITVGEWKEFTKALNGITNVTPMAKVAYSKRWGKLQAKSAGKDQTYQFDVNGKKFNLTRDEIRAINESETPIEALRGKFSDGAISAEDEAALQKLITTPGKVESKLGVTPKVNTAKGTLQNEYDFAKLKAIQQQRQAMINAGRDPNASAWTRLKGRMTEYGLDDANMAYSQTGNFTNLRRFFDKNSTPESTGFDAFYATQRGQFRAAESARKAIEAEKRVAGLQKAMEEGGMKVTDQAALDAANAEYQTALQEFMRVTGTTDEASAIAELARMETAYAGRGRFNYDATTGNYDRFGKQLEGIRKEVANSKSTMSTSAKALRDARTKLNSLTTEESSLSAKLLTLQRAESVAARKLTAAEKAVTTAQSELDVAKNELSALPKKGAKAARAAKQAEVNSKQTALDTAKTNADAAKVAHESAAKAVTDANDRLAAISTEKTSQTETLNRSNDAIQKARSSISKYRRMFSKPSRAELLRELGLNNTRVGDRFDRFGSLTEKELQDIMALRKSKYDALLKAREQQQNYDRFLKAKELMERKITNFADPRYSAAVTGGIKNPARFQQMLRDLTSKNYNEDSVMKALSNPELLAKMKALYKFKKGGQIPRYWNGSFFKKVGDGVKSAMSSYSPTDALQVYGVIKANQVTDKNLEDLTKVRASELPALHYNNVISTNNIQAPYENSKGQINSAINRITSQTSNMESRLAGQLAGIDKLNDVTNQEASALSQQLNAQQQQQANIDNTNIKAAYDRDVYNRKLRDSINARNVDLITQGRKAKEHQWQILRNLYSTGRRHAEQQEYLMRMDDALNNDTGYKEAYRNYQLAKESYDMDPNEDTKKELKEAKVNLSTVTDAFKREYGRITPPPSNVAFGNTMYHSQPSYRGNWFDNVGNEYSLASYESGGSIGKMTQAEMVKLLRSRETQKQKERDSYRKQLDKYAERTAKGSKSLAYQYYLKLINTIK